MTWTKNTDDYYSRRIPIDEGYLLAEVWDNDPWSYSIVCRMEGYGASLVDYGHNYSTANVAKSTCTKALKKLREMG